MWMRLSSGREELVLNEDHIKRLLGEGAVEIADPRMPQETEISEEAPDDSQNNDGGSDSASQDNDQRPEPGAGDDGDTVHGSTNTGQTRRKPR